MLSKDTSFDSGLRIAGLFLLSSQNSNVKYQISKFSIVCSIVIVMNDLFISIYFKILFEE